MATIYIFPVYRLCFTGKPDATLPLAQRRLLNMPLVLGAIGLIGWLIGVSGNFETFLDQAADVRRVILTYAGDGLLMGSLIFVVSYYLLEFLSRRYFIPGFFAEGRLSETQGTLALSIRARFFILFFAVGIFPLLLMVRIVRRLSRRGRPKATCPPSLCLRSSSLCWEPCSCT